MIVRLKRVFPCLHDGRSYLASLEPRSGLEPRIGVAQLDFFGFLFLLYVFLFCGVSHRHYGVVI